MPKSIYAVGGIGAAGCLLLTLFMQHLVQVRGDQAAAPVARELEELFGAYLDGPVRIAVAAKDGTPTMTVHMVAKPGVVRERLVTSADSVLWRQVGQMREPPQQVRFEVEDTGGAPTVVIDTKPPRFGAPRQKAAASAAPPQQR